MNNTDIEIEPERVYYFLQKVEKKEKNKELECPLVFDEPFENFFVCKRPLDSVMYTVYDFDSFVRRYKDVIIGTTDYTKTMRRRYELFLALSKGRYQLKGNLIYELKDKMPIYAKRRKTLFIKDLEVLYKMRLLHVYSEKRFYEYLAALKIVFDRRARKTAPANPTND